MKSAEFLTKTTSEKEIFTYEDFTHEQVMMYEATKDFINKTIIPNIESIEKQEGTIVSDILKQAGELGLLGVTVPESLGGLSMDFNTSMLIADIIGISGSFGTTYGAHTGIGTLPILYYGNKVQKEKVIAQTAKEKEELELQKQEKEKLVKVIQKDKKKYTAEIDKKEKVKFNYNLFKNSL